MTALLFNLRVDLDDPGQGVAIDWMRALATRVDRLAVITHHAGSLPVIPNVEIHSMGRERGWSEPRRVAAFYRRLTAILRKERPTFCFSHMMSVATVLAGPVLRPLGIPILQWYTHSGTPWHVRIALRFSTHVLTATEESFSLKSPKVIVTGHGIPTDVFTPGGDARRRREPLLLTVGRISPIKHIETMIRALALLRDAGSPVRLRIVGGARVPADRAYEASLRAEVDALGLQSRVTFSGAVARDALVDVYRHADVFVHACDSGLDKAGLEAMSCGVPLVSSSPGFRRLIRYDGLDLSVAPGDPAALAERIGWVLRLDDAHRRRLGLGLREAVRAQHDLDRLMDRVVALGCGAESRS